MLFLLAWLLAAGSAQAQRASPYATHDPFGGVRQYPQFRNLSGLAGGGYGVDAQGYPSLDGPVAWSTPVAHVLGHDRFRLALANMSFNSLPDFRHRYSNGTGVITYGHTFGDFNLTATDLIKSTQFDQSYNLQIQYVPPIPSRVNVSIGVQDILGLGGSAGEGQPTDRFSSRSIFGVLTYRFTVQNRPLYVNAGIGTHRYNKGFASASYPILKPLRLWLEFDGFGFNEGFLHSFFVGSGRSRFEFNTLLGYTRGRYFSAGFGVGF